MGQRNMLYTTPMIDVEMDQQGRGNLHPEPSVLYGNMTSYPQPNVHALVPAPGNRNNIDVQNLPEHQGAFSYGMTHYNGIQHHHPAGNLDLPVATASSHYNMFMTPSPGARVFPVLSNHGPHEQLPFPSNHGTLELSADSYRRNSHLVDGVGGIFKRKDAEGGIPGTFHHFYAPGGSSSSAPMRARPFESDATMMDASSFGPPDYRGNDILSTMEFGPHRIARNRSGAIGVDSSLAQNSNHLIQANYRGQPFHTTATPWLDQQFNSNGGDNGTLPWNQAPALPYMHGSMNGGCMEAANMGVQGYQVAVSNRSSISFVHPPPMPQGQPNFHHPPPLIQGVRGHNIDFHPQVATSSRRLSTNSSVHASMNPFHGSLETGNRFVGPVPSTGLGIYRPHRREVMFEATPRQRNLPHLRVLPEDGVAILEFSNYHGVGNPIDHHRDMRLDIDHMSYEELLALGEQIGTVGSGLSEEIILSHLKTRKYVSSTSSSQPEDAVSTDQELNFCVICQADYKDQEKIGILDCGHEYHVDCTKTWLLVKNTCPVCKSLALTTEQKGS
ncbi:hypothetical protein RJ639_039844 [Escallonia herrerae]|uniref:RING-type E3 ubiquitin transferase n=1 Tax=Escallonia herrerae TaxID=1293975 RepID=A0AA88WLT9_9ASTE|nr:hypothetical protein RJ639_039844 [Escallonia herrerae]